MVANGTRKHPGKAPLWPQGRNGVCGNWWSAWFSSAWCFWAGEPTLVPWPSSPPL